MKFLPNEINIPNLKVNSIGRLSSFSFGQNYKGRRFVSNKKQQGFGEQNGDLVLTNRPIGFVYDNDIFDANTNTNITIHFNED